MRGQPTAADSKLGSSKRIKDLGRPTQGFNITHDHNLENNGYRIEIVSRRVLSPLLDNRVQICTYRVATIYRFIVSATAR